MKQKPDKHTNENEKPSKSTLEKMGFTVDGHWAERDSFSIYLPTLTYSKLIDNIYLHAFNLGKQNKLDEIKKWLEI
jgi:hypothetical protein